MLSTLYLRDKILRTGKGKKMMSLVLSSPTSCALSKSYGILQGKQASSSSSVKPGRFSVKAFFFKPSDEPILKEALKEPVAFMGGMFAGLLRLDLNEDPLKEWVSRTAEASGITEEEIKAQDFKPEEAPQQIEIE